MTNMNRDQIQADYREKRRDELRALAGYTMGAIFIHHLQRDFTVDEAWDIATDQAIKGANVLIAKT